MNGFTLKGLRSPAGRRSLSRQVWLVTGLLLLAGCAVGPDYKRPQVASPDAWKPEEGWTVGEPKDQALKGAWWELYGDPVLNQLEGQALQNNLSISMAQARLDLAKEQTNVALSGFMPQVSLQGGASRFQTSADRPLSSYSSPNQQVRQDDYNLAIGVSYEADLSGRIRRRAESARAMQAQSTADFENLRLLVCAQLAADYFSLRQLDADLHLLEQQRQSQERVLALVKVRYDNGFASAMDLDTYRTQLNNTRQLILALRDQRARFEHAMATLVGQDAPSFQVTPASAPLNFSAVPDIPLVQPSTLLERRPDVASAERAMATANAQIGIAKSAYFPTINLASLVGSDANRYSLLASGQPSTLWSLGLTGTQMLFDGGRTAATIKQAEAVYQQSVASYRQTVLSAFEEVQNSLSSQASLQASATAANQSAADAAHSLALMRLKNDVGTASLLEVTLSEQNWISYERQMLQTRTQQLLNSVQLIKALGGGWVASK